MSEKKIDLAKYRSVGAIRSGAQQYKKTILHVDDQGKPDGGKQIEHWSGRVDAEIKVNPVVLKVKNTGDN